MGAGPASVRVFHRGALGDVVLIWPALRALRAQGCEVVFISDHEKAALTARELGVSARAIEHPEFNALWAQDGPLEVDESAGVVISTLAGPGSVWAARAARRYPRATLRHVQAPLDRRSAMQLAEELGGDDGPAAIRPAPDAPVVLHVGAGSEDKRWPVERWVRLAARAGPARLIAGEVERERFSAAERRAFESAGGRYIRELAALAEVLKGAGAVVGADSGPGHLAAQLGGRVVSLFGPTDPARWAPIGPGVRVVAPRRPAPMAWLSVERVLEEISPQRH